MSHFTKAIETPNGFMQFYFNRLFTPDGLRYHISAVGRNQRAITFLMQEEDKRWCIVKNESNPYWIEDVETRLSDAIIIHISLTTLSE